MSVVVTGEACIILPHDQGKWMASYDGFNLTRKFHSNNSTGIMHDVASVKIDWFAHRTKRGSGADFIRYRGDKPARNA